MTTKETNAVVDDNPNKKLPIPEWINEEFFQDILAKDYPDFNKVVNFNVKAAIAPGENYASNVFRATIEIQLKGDFSLLKHHKSLITSYFIKTSLPQPDTLNVFSKEKEMYQNILPQFEKLYKESTGKIIHFAPECKIIKEVSETTTFVLEDLREKNFKNVNRFVGFDMNHMEHFLKKLAEFHAVSAVYQERVGPFPEKFTHSFLIEENLVIYEEENKKKEDNFLHIMKEWGDCEKYIELWPKYEKYIKWLADHDIPTSDEFAVLCHGDCWCNNIMFQYNNQGEIEYTYLVDFQMCKWGTPAQDLYYIIMISAENDIKVSKFDKMMRIYHENLAENLKLLNYSKPIPTLKDIHIMMFKYSAWGIFAGYCIMPVILYENESGDVDEFETERFRNPRFIKAFKQLLPWWENRGMFSV